MLQCFDAKPFYCSQFSFLSSMPITVLSSDNVVIIKKKELRDKLLYLYQFGTEKEWKEVSVTT